MRLNTAIAKAMGYSRRAADKAIEGKRVLVNGSPARLGQPVDPVKDSVTVDGKKISLAPPRSLTIAFYKPRNVVSSRSDPQGRKTVMDCLPPEFSDLKPAGRLDFESEGLLLLSTEGSFILRHTHPRYQTEKEYVVKLKIPATPAELRRLKKGIKLAEGTAAADRAEKRGSKTLQIVIHQGWNRQIRRMVAATKNEVVSLKRTRVGSIALGNLKPGQWKEISSQEISNSRSPSR